MAQLCLVPFRACMQSGLCHKRAGLLLCRSSSIAASGWRSHSEGPRAVGPVPDLDALNSATSIHARDFLHGALHPDPRARMSPAEMCLHPFMDEARDVLLTQQHQQGGRSQIEWSVHMEQLRVRTPAAKGRGPEARAVSIQQPAFGCLTSSCLIP